MRPFENIRVLDLTHVFAGPFCTYQLAVMGADVIKIEPPFEPDMMRCEGAISETNDSLLGTHFMSQNAGKRSLTLNLQDESGKNIFKRLILGADVLVQNFCGDAIERLGLGSDDLAKVNPGLIFCSITGFGLTGPKANHPAYDTVIQAFSGLMSANGTKNAEPVRVGPAVVDYGTGAQAAMAICAALYQREKTGRGQNIDVSMLDAALMLMSSTTTDALATGKAPRVQGNAHPFYAGYATYPTAEGLLMVGAWTNRQLSQLFRAFNEHQRAAEIERTPRRLIGKYFKTDTATISQHLLRKTADEWEAILNELHIPAARVRTIDEAINHPQVISRQVIQSVGQSDNKVTPGDLPVAAFMYSHGSPEVRVPPPRHGQHTDEILDELGVSKKEIEKFRQTGVV